MGNSLDLLVRMQRQAICRESEIISIPKYEM